MEDSKPPSPEDYDARVEKIVSRFSHYRKSVRDHAAAELAALGPDAAEAILKAARREREHWVNTRGIWTVGSGIAGMCLAKAFLAGSKPWLWWPLAKLVLFGIPLLWALRTLISTQANRHFKAGPFVPALCGISDVRVLELLITYYHLSDSIYQDKIEESIPSLVAIDPQEAWNSLLPETRLRLGFLLHVGQVKLKSPAAIQAVLHLFAEVGSERELKTTRKLALHSKDEDVKVTAAQCSANLAARLADIAEGNRLLRAASTSDAQDLLVRATSATSHNNTDTLLKADSTDSPIPATLSAGKNDI